MLTDRAKVQAAPVIACDMNAIPAQERDAHAANGRALFGTVREVRELADGYALRLPTGSEALLQAANFIARERLCCSFFHFALEVEPDGGPFWLQLTGQEGTKEFVKQVLLEHVGADVALPPGIRQTG